MHVHNLHRLGLVCIGTNVTLRWMKDDLHIHVIAKTFCRQGKKMTKFIPILYTFSLML